MFPYLPLPDVTQTTRMPRRAIGPVLRGIPSRSSWAAPRQESLIRPTTRRTTSVRSSRGRASAARGMPTTTTTTTTTTTKLGRQANKRKRKERRRKKMNMRYTNDKREKENMLSIVFKNFKFLKENLYINFYLLLLKIYINLPYSLVLVIIKVRIEQTVIRIILLRGIIMRLAADKKSGSLSIDKPGIYMRVIEYIKSLCNRVTLLKPTPIRHLSLLFQAGHEHNKDRLNLYHDA